MIVMSMNFMFQLTNINNNNNNNNNNHLYDEEADITSTSSFTLNDINLNSSSDESEFSNDDFDMLKESNNISDSNIDIIETQQIERTISQNYITETMHNRFKNAQEDDSNFNLELKKLELS